MGPAYYQHSSYLADRSLKSRARAGLLALVAVVLLLLALLRLGAFQPLLPVAVVGLSTFDVGPAAASRSEAEHKAAAARPKARKASPPPPPATPQPPLPPSPLPGVINLNRADFAASDIGKIKSAEPSRGEDTGTETADNASTYGPGDGPGGKKLFAAEWYREPTRAEMDYYIPRNAQLGWGVIACQTIDRNHVDNCRQLGESPGSGISRGMRQAAWQFLIRPPRINGKPLIGAWVRIRYDIVRGIEK